MALCATLIGTASAWALAPHDKAVGVQPAQLGYNQADKGQHTQAHADAAQNEVATAVTDNEAKAARERKEDRKDKLRSDTIAGIIGAITIGVLLIQTLVFYIQAKRLKETINTMQSVSDGQSADMKAALEIASRNADAAKRSADFLAFQEAPKIYIRDIIAAGDGAVVKIANSGKTTAIVHSIVYGYGVFDFLPAVPAYPYGGPRIIEKDGYTYKRTHT